MKKVESVKDENHECSSDGEEKKDSSFVIELDATDMNAQNEGSNSGMTRLKMLTGEFADVWLHEGNRALQYFGDTKYAKKA